MPDANFQDLWALAIDAYEEKTGYELDDGNIMVAIAEAGSAEDVVNVLETEMKAFKAFREGDSKWASLRNKLATLTHVVLALNDAAGELASASVRDQKWSYTQLDVTSVGRSGRKSNVCRIRSLARGMYFIAAFLLTAQDD